MTANDVLPWLNLVLVPILIQVSTINSRLAAIEATHRTLSARLSKLDGIAP